MHARKSRGEWSAIIKAFERSGESHEQFCSKRGLAVGSFRYWLYRVRRTGGAATTDVVLLPVEVTTPVARYAPSDIVIAIAGVEVRVAIGADVGYVAGLVAEIRARC
jgi:hypothetical protein